MITDLGTKDTQPTAAHGPAFDPGVFQGHHRHEGEHWGNLNVSYILNDIVV